MFKGTSQTATTWRRRRSTRQSTAQFRPWSIGHRLRHLCHLDHPGEVCQGTKEREGKKVAKTDAVIEVDNIIHELSNGGEVSGNYDLLHRTKGGLRMLIGTVFTFLSTPEEKHAAATYIFNQEVRIHRSKAKAAKCLREGIRRPP